MVDIIIAVYNIKRRGFDRLDYSLYSLKLQTDRDFNVIVMDGSESGQAARIEGICIKYPFVKYYHLPLKEFNKPMLHNQGVKLAKSKWVMTTDVDYLFQEDFIATTKQFRNNDRFLLKQVDMLPKMRIDFHRVKMWQWPQTVPFDKVGDGACQYTLRQWFLNNPYEERMKGWGVMDNHQHWKAKVTGLTPFWLPQSRILHQFHWPEKFQTMPSDNQFRENQKLFEQIQQDHGSTSEIHEEL